MPTPRTAHPYRDLDVIDARAPRFNQATVGIVSLVAVLTGWWPLLGLMGAQLGIGLRYGRRYCLACVAYFELVQPRFGEGPIEDSRPPRFANQIGFVVLTSATLAWAVGWTAIGAALGLLVAAPGPPGGRDRPVRGLRAVSHRRPSPRHPAAGGRSRRVGRAGRCGRCRGCRCGLRPPAVHRLQHRPARPRGRIGALRQRQRPGTAGPRPQIRRRPGADGGPRQRRRARAPAGRRLAAATGLRVRARVG